MYISPSSNLGSAQEQVLISAQVGKTEPGDFTELREQRLGPGEDYAAKICEAEYRRERSYMSKELKDLHMCSLESSVGNHLLMTKVKLLSFLKSIFQRKQMPEEL